MTEASYYQKWKEKLQKELKTNDLGSEKRILDNGLEFDPFIDPTELRSYSLPLPFSQELSIGYICEGAAEKEQNQLLKRLLQYDLRVIRMRANSETEWPRLLEDVHPSMIHIDIDFETESDGRRFMEWREKHSDQNPWSISSNHPLPALRNDCVFEYRNFAGKDISEQSETLKEIDRLLSGEPAGLIKLAVSISENLLLTLPYLRAIKFLVNRHGRRNDVIIEANGYPGAYAENKEQELILGGIMAVWSAISGVPHLYFNFSNGEQDPEHARLLLNIQNLIKLESGAGVDEDVLDGAYIIEDLTHKLMP